MSVLTKAAMENVHWLVILSFIISTSAYTLLLIWGLNKISIVFGSTGNESEDARPRILKMIDTADESKSPSEFAKVSVFMGSIGLAAIFSAIGYWIIYSIYFIGKIDNIKDIWVYFLAGSAMFLPYAFDRLTTLFKS